MHLPILRVHVLVTLKNLNHAHTPGPKERSRYGSCSNKSNFRLDLRKYSFSQRVIDDWNSLPEDVVSSETIIQFKNRLNKFWKNKNTKFEPDCYSYPLAHARHHQLNERRRERAQESRDYTRPQRQ